MHDEFSTPRTRQEKIDSLIHLYVDGGLNRRELVRKLARLTGGVAGATAIIKTAGLAAVAPDACPANVKVAENDPAIQWENITYPSDAGSTKALLARPRNQTAPLPGIVVIHENRGLVEHIRDVTRRFAKAGFVALGIDLLSREGGTEAFPDDMARVQAYGRTLAPDRYNDIWSGLDYLWRQNFTLYDAVGAKIGAVGFCAGGGNVLYSVFNSMPLQAAVSFYGPPPNPLPPATNLTTPTLCIFSETDRNQAARIPELTAAFVESRVTFGIHLYKGTGHGFHNDTGAVYNATAACDAWAKTIDFFNTHLRTPRTPG